MISLANSLIAAGLHAHEAQAYAAEGILPQQSILQHGDVAIANDARFTESYFSQPLTTFAVGWKDGENLDAELEFVAPSISVPRRFEYAEDNSAEEFLSETTDDVRAIGADFKRVEYKGTKTSAKTANRGLTMRVDLDEVADKANWETMYTEKLLRRVKRGALRRAVTLLAAAATNTAKTWDTSSGKDPDQDVLSDIVTSTTAIGIKPNKVLYGDTAWSKRILAHRAQSSAGGFASAGISEEELAAWLGVDRVMRSRARYQSTSSAKAEIVSNLVLMFMALDGQDTEEPSNIKRFVTPTASGGPFRVYTQQIGAKLYDITVEHYDLIKITSTLGIRKFTVS